MPAAAPELDPVRHVEGEHRTDEGLIMKSLASKLIPVAIASILCGVAVAGGGDKDKMSMMDKDGDGKVSAMEHADGAKMMFTKMDTNKDGEVTASAK
jgi:hypothetical protein